MTVVIVIRHPDFANDFEVFETPIDIIDVDYGQNDLHDPEEFEEWAEGIRDKAKRIMAKNPEAAGYLMSILADAREDYQS